MSDEIKPSGIGSYAPPLDKLLTLGRPGETGVKNWLDYRELGVGPEHVSELIRMVGDQELDANDPEGDEIWGSIHAWRALGQLKAESAVEPLLNMVADLIEDNDWVLNEFQEVFGMIGPANIPLLTAFLKDTSQNEYARVTASDGLAHMVEYYPERREEIVEILSQQLELSQVDPEREYINGFVVGQLLHLKAVEAAPVIEQAYKAGIVDKSIAGDWEDAQIELGLLEARLTPRPRYNPILNLPFGDAPSQPIPASRSMPLYEGSSTGTFGSNKTPSNRKAIKTKRKIEKASRKKNRKRK